METDEYRILTWKDIPTGDLGDFIVPDGVKEIARGTFARRSDLSSIVIPNGVVRICREAFANSGYLARVTLPDTLEIIEDHAFLRCESLSEINLPDSLLKIGVSAFFHCSSLNRIIIPKRIRRISIVFTGLTDVIIPDSATLRSINISRCDLQKMNLSESVRDVSFSMCSSLEEVNLSNSVRSVSFSDCPALKKIKLPASVRNVYFRNCTGLTEIVIPDSVKEIVAGAFENCTALTRAVLPNSIRRIRECAFFGCTNLTWAVIPDSVREIGLGAFSGCEKLISGKKEVLPSKSLHVCFLLNTAIKYESENIMSMFYDIMNEQKERNRKTTIDVFQISETLKHIVKWRNIKKLSGKWMSRYELKNRLDVSPSKFIFLPEAISLAIDSVEYRLKSLLLTERPNRLLFVIVDDIYFEARKAICDEVKRRIQRKRRNSHWEFLYLPDTISQKDAEISAKMLGIRHVRNVSEMKDGLSYIAKLISAAMDIGE